MFWLISQDNRLFRPHGYPMVYSSRAEAEDDLSDYEEMHGKLLIQEGYSTDLRKAQR
jgi:hypothetical protein